MHPGELAAGFMPVTLRHRSAAAAADACAALAEGQSRLTSQTPFRRNKESRKDGYGITTGIVLRQLP